MKLGFAGQIKLESCARLVYRSARAADITEAVQREVRSTSAGGNENGGSDLP